MSSFGAIVCGIAIFPTLLQHIFGGYRGTENIDNLKNANLFQNLKAFASIINQQLFGKIFLPILIVGALFAVVRYLYKRELLQEHTEETVQVCGIRIALLSSICYFILVSKIAIMLQWRFFSLIYQIIIVTFVCGSTYVLKKYLKKQTWCRIIIGSICSLRWMPFILRTVMMCHIMRKL